MKKDEIIKLVSDYCNVRFSNISMVYHGKISKKTSIKMLDWIRHWGNGGGMLSIETVIIDQINASRTCEELINAVKNDPYYADAPMAFMDTIYSMFSGTGTEAQAKALSDLW